MTGIGTVIGTHFAAYAGTDTWMDAAQKTIELSWMRLDQDQQVHEE